MAADDPFHIELRRLRDATELTVASILSRAKTQDPPLRLSKQTLSDWFNGKVKAPRITADQDRLIMLLETVAKDRGYSPRGIAWWRQLRADQPRQRGSSTSLGKVIGELLPTDALAYEVHPAIAIGSTDLPTLPPYLEREHDVRLRANLATAEDGSRFILLIGGSSTGKTRAGWEAVRAVLPNWRIWHPLEPRRPEAVTEALLAKTLEPRTVIWLNEAQAYLQPIGAGERAASALQEFLKDPSQGPVVVLGSMWPEHWAALRDPASTEHIAARMLLERSIGIAVPSEFAANDIVRHRDSINSDARLSFAAAHGRLTQHLAGGPDLLHRYRFANEHARAVIEAAIDARRLSRWDDLAYDFLLEAAPGYLARDTWDRTSEGSTWFDEALQDLTGSRHGIPGVLTRRRPLDTSVQAIGYRLADYIEQVGGHERAHDSPPQSFWNAAAATCTDPDVLADLGRSAQVRGRLELAQRLFEAAAMRGHTDALRRLASRHYELGDREGAEHVARQAVMTNDYHPLVSLANWLENDGDQAGADRLRQEAADHADLDALGELVQQRIESGDLSEAEDLALIASDFGHVQPIVELAEHCEAVGEIETAKRMYLEAADHWDVRALLRLAEWEVEAGDRAEADEIFAEISTTGDSLELMLLAMTRERIGDRDVAREIYYRLVSLDEPIAYDELCRLAIEDGDHATALNLAVEAAKDGYHDPLDQIADRVAESAGQAAADDLYRQDGDAGLLVVLGRRRAANGERAEATALFEEAATSEDETAQRLALLELCMLRISAQEFEEAEHLARQAVDSTDSFALEMLADELAKAGQYETAELLYRELLNSGHQCLNDLAAVYHLKGRPDTAHQIRMYGLTADGQIAAPWSM